MHDDSVQIHCKALPGGRFRDRGPRPGFSPDIPGQCPGCEVVNLFLKKSSNDKNVHVALQGRPAMLRRVLREAEGVKKIAKAGDGLRPGVRSGADVSVQELHDFAVFANPCCNAPHRYCLTAGTKAAQTV